MWILRMFDYCFDCWLPKYCCYPLNYTLLWLNMPIYFRFGEAFTVTQWHCCNKNMFWNKLKHSKCKLPKAWYWRDWPICICLLGTAHSDDSVARRCHMLHVIHLWRWAGLLGRAAYIRSLLSSCLKSYLKLQLFLKKEQSPSRHWWPDCWWRQHV